MRLVGFALAGLVLGGCTDDKCDPMKEACVYSAAVSTITVPAGHEDEDTCQSWTLNNPTELWVNQITQHNDGGYHHANWFFVPDDQFVVPDGSWTCSEHDFTELVAALEGGYLFALSTQSHDETQTLPAGAGIRIPPYSRVIGSSHLLNAADDAVTSTMMIRLDTIPPRAVSAKLAPARIQYHDLHLDAASRSAFTTECTFDDAYMKTTGEPLHYELMYTLSHYHKLGTYTQLEILGGPRDGEVLMRHDGNGDNYGNAINNPVDLGTIGAKGLRFTCGFDNPRAVPVGWGIGDQEMCVVALQAVTDIGWDGDVQTGTGHQAGVATNGEIDYQGPCSLQAFPWDFTKPGGPPR